MTEEYWKTTLVLVRHGQARSSDGSYGVETPLSDLGRRQADALAAELSTRGAATAVYTSPFPRAVQTSAPICERLGLEAIVDERLAEFALVGYRPEEILQKRPDLLVWRPEHRAVEGGETVRDFSARVVAFCDEAVERHRGEHVAVVSHAGTIDAVLRWSLGLAPDTPWQHEFDVSNGSITELEVWPRGRTKGGAPRYAAIRGVGDVGHLGGLVSEL